MELCYPSLEYVHVVKKGPTQLRAMRGRWPVIQAPLARGLLPFSDEGGIGPGRDVTSREVEGRVHGTAQPDRRGRAQATDGRAGVASVDTYLHVGPRPRLTTYDSIFGRRRPIFAIHTQQLDTRHVSATAGQVSRTGWQELSQGIHRHPN